MSSTTKLAVHIAGHLTIAGITPDLRPTEVLWHRLPSEEEIAHVEVELSRASSWEDPADRRQQIASQAAVAVAGGAAEAIHTGAVVTGPRDLHAAAGAIDFEHAHEWLTLQRYDPDQDTLERELLRIHDAVRTTLNKPLRWAALMSAVERLEAAFAHARSSGSSHETFPADQFLAVDEAGPTVAFGLDATLFGRS